MLSTFPASFSYGSLLGNPFPTFEPGFPLWESDDASFFFHPLSPQEEEPVVSPQPSQEPVSPNSGSDTSNPTTNSGSDEPNRDKIKNPSSGSDEPNRDNSKNLGSGSGETSRLGSIIDERKRRRMISNRESARRSRMRKQKHLENLRSQANRLKVGNRELTNRLRLFVHQNRLVETENECLRSEAVILRQRLWDIRQVLLVRQLQQHLNPPSAWPCTNNERQFPFHSLIT
ncbi:hypothetical protein CDL12_30555 [Handroanthus impetiginosus]|uniref:BZIP domain-containing protein n=1 Tax=Handroanthus impetiginosus TaxID=429701 RepID=A0A2G9FVP9_9LAMI|nr:hypothetical protein CDL12_30555 [Handroanthus impetiginosus]